ncbi:MAG: hypothetical protein R6U36_06740 [Candidatus Fermentibacteraceae bacterium]
MPEAAGGPTGRIAAAAIILAAMAAFVFLLPGESFWCMDEGNRYLQTWSLSRRLEFPPELPYPGSQGLEGTGLAETLRPLPGHYGYMEDGGLYSQYNPLLALLAVPFHLTLGQWGIYLPGLLAGVVLVYLLAVATAESGYPFGLRLLLFVLCTGLPFYMATFFSNTLALALAFGSLLLLRRGRTVAAAVLAAAALVLREEMVLVYPLFLMFLPRRPGTGRLIASVLLAAAVFLALQRLLTGQWLGVHLGASGIQQELYASEMSWMEARFYIVRRAFINAFPGFGWEGLALGLALWASWAMRLATRGRSSRAFAYAGLALSVVPLAAMFVRGLPSLDTVAVQHPLVIFPVLWLARPPRRFLYAVGGVVLLMVLLMSPMHTEDLSWGFRHGMFLFLLAALFIGGKPPRSLVCSVLAVGLLSTAASLSVLTAKRLREQETIDALRSNGGAVITTSWEQPQNLAALMTEGVPIFHASRARALHGALQAFSDRQPLVMVRRGNTEAVLGTAAAAGMECRLVWSGSPADLLTDARVFSCRRKQGASPRMGTVVRPGTVSSTGKCQMPGRGRADKGDKLP